MLGLVASLGLMIGLVHLPLSDAPDRVGWGPSPLDPIAVQEVQSESASQENPEQSDDSPPQTDTRSRPSAPDSVSLAAHEQDRPRAQTEAGDSTRRSSSEVRSISTLEPQAHIPEIVGGMGSLYLNIEYPKKAREQGIEGVLKLEFTVETDGSVSNVEVVKSLHPLCDSAAVAGVQSVKFVPAKHNGDPIPIRMKLPVRFRLISSPHAPTTAGTNP